MITGPEANNMANEAVAAPAAAEAVAATDPGRSMGGDTKPRPQISSAVHSPQAAKTATGIRIAEIKVSQIIILEMIQVI